MYDDYSNAARHVFHKVFSNVIFHNHMSIFNDGLILCKRSLLSRDFFAGHLSSIA